MWKNILMNSKLFWYTAPIRLRWYANTRNLEPNGLRLYWNRLPLIWPDALWIMAIPALSPQAVKPQVLSQRGFIFPLTRSAKALHRAFRSMVPATRPDIRLVLKSGNFGQEDFFGRALSMTRQEGIKLHLK